VFLERGAESIRVKGEFVPIPYVENHLATVAGIRDHAVWKRKGALADDEVVLYAVTDSVPVVQLRTRIAELPAFMRPVAVARVAALPRDAAAGKVQRRLLSEHPVLDWVEL
jgi:crotonobetaine/carnitine-CoA ligase